MSNINALLTILLTSTAFFTVSSQNLTECTQCCCDVGRDECLEKKLICISCLDGYWGGKCINKCPIECLACDKEPVREGSYIGPILYHICTKCVDGKYPGDTDAAKTCKLSCPNECISCTSLSNCSECKPGHYFINGKCIACSSACIDCMSATDCTSCTMGYYGDVCDQRCSLGCQDRRCDKVTGTCTCSVRFAGAKCDQCAETFYGQRCESDCSTTCLNKLCYEESEQCKSCTQGFYGEFCNRTCSTGCKFGICSRDDGICFDGCLSTCSGDRCCVNNKNCMKCLSTTECATCGLGYYDYQCELPCSSACKDGCIKSSGECSSCLEDKYGNFCQYNCSKTCKNYRTRCSQSKGECLVGCDDGYYGVYCRNMCNTTCADGTCDRVEGLCLKAEDPELISFDQHVKQISIAVVVTFILSIILAVAAYYLLSFIRRRTAKNKPNKQNRHRGEQTAEPYDTLSSEQTNTGTDYDIITSRNDEYTGARV